jgi:hypothetical protein
MNVIAYGGTNAIISDQTTNIYLEDYIGKKITKQNLLDLLLSEIWDERDGVILRHINNVNVDITRLNDNVAITEITEQGYYIIKMECEDTDNNLGKIFWQNRSVSLNTDYIKILIRENQPPVIFINEINTFKLSDFVSNIITRDDLNTQLVNKVIDDRDGIITTDMLNIRIFKIDMGETEVLYIDEIGDYKIYVRVQDSDGAVTTAGFTIEVIAS